MINREGLNPSALSRNSEIAKSKESGEVLEPIIVASVTLGKELHAGHMLLLGVADIMRINLKCDRPIVLVNNNMGPRVAAALVKLSLDLSLELDQAAMLSDKGEIPVEKLVASYRTRDQKPDQEGLDRAMELLALNDFDVFSAISKKTKEELRRAGFNTEVVNESTIAKKGDEIVELANPVWTGTGFMPVFIGQSLRILKKSGFLTASGAQVAGLAGLLDSEEKLERKKIFVFVDSSFDTKDAVTSFSGVSSEGRAVSVLGAGFGIGGEIASGTDGKAMSLSQVVDKFRMACPEGNVVKALRHLILTTPVFSEGLNSSEFQESFFNFKSQKDFIDTLVKSHFGALEFENKVKHSLKILETKIGDRTTTNDPKIAKIIGFIPKKANGLANVRDEDVINGNNKFERIMDKDGGSFYIRKNFFRDKLADTLRLASGLESVTNSDLEAIKFMVTICMERNGYDV